MSSLFASLGIAREALLAQQMGLEVTQNNISNVNTPGYTRQRAVFVPGDSVAQFEYQAGMGVRLDSIDSYRDRLLDYRVNQELQLQGEFGYASITLGQVEAILNENAGLGLESTLSAFFNSFESLANTPEDASLRQQVLAYGDRLGAEFRSIYEQIQSIQTLQDQTIADTAGEINFLSGAIAKLNAEVAAVHETNGNASTLRDQRQVLLDRLAGLVDLSYFETESGTLTVMTRQGVLLAVADQSYELEVTTGAGGRLDVYANGVDITSGIESGKLGGLLRVRDVNIAGYLTTLDDMAAAIISRVNEQHALGADIDGLAGGDFFVPFVQTIPGSNQGAARSMSVLITDTARIAAAGPAAGPGNNDNAQSLAGIQHEMLMAGSSATLNQFYANLIFNIGMDAKASTENLDTQDHLLVQLQNQRDSRSAVSLDEEAVNIIRYQKAYEANARFIRLIDSLTEEIINLLGV